MSFHVPKRNAVSAVGRPQASGNNGAFELESPEPGWRLYLMASDGAELALAHDRWEHVSVHAFRVQGKKRQTRIPTWKEMCFAKDVFWDGEDAVMQLHPPRSEYVNRHADVLHLWRPIYRDLPRPPKVFV